MSDKILPYLSHLPSCNLMQDWTEAMQAMADTPSEFRDEGHYEALLEIEDKRNKCTCGLKEIMTEREYMPTGRIWEEIPVEKDLPPYPQIVVVLIDGRIPMLSQIRPGDNGPEWWSLGMQNAHRLEEKKKCVTHWLKPVDGLSIAEVGFKETVAKWMEWTINNFPKSTAASSLIHLQRETKELVEAIEDHTTREHHEGVVLREYADNIICLLTAAGKSGFTIEQLMRAIVVKININIYHRKWMDNGDGTYSHIKD